MDDFYKQHLLKLDDPFIKAVGLEVLRHKGIGFAVPRATLCGKMRTKFPEYKEIDRKVRRAIEMLRGQGWVIGSSLKGDGYFMVQNRIEYESFREEFSKRAYQIIRTTQRMDESAERQFPKNPTEPKQLELLQ